MEQYYKIADLTVKMDTFGRTERQALPYRISARDPADMRLESRYQELKAARPEMDAETCEHITSGKQFYYHLLQYDGMVLHAAAVAMDGKAYLFSADSGVGKSTHADLWQQVYGKDRVQFINDDKPALRWREGAWYVYGTPWCGKRGLHQNLCCPLAGIALLERSAKNSVEPYKKDDVVFRLLKQTYRFRDAQKNEKVLSLIGCLLEHVPVWRLQCNMEPEAAILAQAAMTKMAQRRIP